MRWWSKGHKWVYGFLLATQGFFFVMNLATGSYGFVALNVVSAAIIFLGEVFVARIEAERQSKVHEYRSAVIYSRTQDNDDAERYYMGLLRIWGGDPP